jgi:hypothetical protein
VVDWLSYLAFTAYSPDLMVIAGTYLALSLGWSRGAKLQARTPVGSPRGISA